MNKINDQIQKKLNDHDVVKIENVKLGKEGAILNERMAHSISKNIKFIQI